MKNYLLMLPAGLLNLEITIRTSGGKLRHQQVSTVLDNRFLCNGISGTSQGLTDHVTCTHRLMNDNHQLFTKIHWSIIKAEEVTARC